MACHPTRQQLLAACQLAHAPTQPLTRRPVLARIATATALLAIAGSASAQTAAIYGAGLEAWTGCWSAEQSLVPAGAVRLVCITPTADVNVANVAAIVDGTVARETIDATGRALVLQAPGCTGTRRAAWSRDSRRLFLTTTGVCRGVPVTTSAIFSISTSGEWVRVEGSAVRGATRVRVARYRDVGVPAGLPMDVATVVGKNALARESTRAAFGAPVRLDDVIEALDLADGDVVAAWVRERAQRFAVTQADLARYDLTGLPTRVADALTAIADSNAVLARAADSASYAAYTMEQQAAEPYDYDFVPLAYWGGGYGVTFASGRVGGRHGGQGRGGTPPAGSGGTVRLGRPYP